MVSKYFSPWGPYGKKYMGLSRIAEHSFKSGIRFDFTVAPAVFGMDIKIRCDACGREVMLPRSKVEKNIKKIVHTGE